MGCPDPIPELFGVDRQLTTGDRIPSGLLVEDLDADGDPDLLLRNSTGAPLVVRQNTGGGILGPAVKIELDTSEEVAAVAVAEVDERSPADILVLLSTGVAVLTRSGPGYAITPGGRVARCEDCSVLLAGRFDGDDWNDLYVMSAVGADLYPGPDLTTVLLPRPPRVDASPPPLATDLDGNGVLDVVGSRAGPGGLPEVAVLLGDESASFTERTRSLEGRAAWRLGATDLDGDGRQEVLAVGPGWFGYLPWEGEGLGRLRVHELEGLRPTALCSFDATADGESEVVVGTDDGTVHVWAGGAGFELLVADSLFHTGAVVALGHGDLEGDGYSDLVVVWTDADTGRGRVTLYQGGTLRGAPPGFTPQ